VFLFVAVAVRWDGTTGPGNGLDYHVDAVGGAAVDPDGLAFTSGTVEPNALRIRMTHVCRTLVRLVADSGNALARAISDAQASKRESLAK
jgi:hypothetical protein